MAEHSNKPAPKGGGEKKSGGGLWGFVSDMFKGVTANINIGAPTRARNGRNPTDPEERMQPVHEDRRETYEETIYRKTEGADGTAPAVRVDRDRKIIARSLEARSGGGGSSAATVPAGAGAPLSRDVRSKMEPRLGGDLSDVRVHTSGESDQAAQGLRAKAFTVGKDVHFGAGNYQPGTKEGDRLLAHELTHVVQGKNGGGVQRKAEHDSDAHDAEDGGGEHGVSDPGEPAEKEADAVADHVAEDLHGAAAAGDEHGAQPGAEGGAAHEGKQAKDKDQDAKSKDAKGKDAKGKDAKGKDAKGAKAASKSGEHKPAGGDDKKPDHAGADAKGAAEAKEHGGAASASSGSGAASASAAPASDGAKPKENAPAIGRKIMRSAQAVAITASAPGTKIFRGVQPAAGSGPRPRPTSPAPTTAAPRPATTPGTQPGGTPPGGGGPQQPPPKKVATSLAIAPTTLPTLKWELSDDLREAQSGVIHAGAPASADPGTEQILAQHPGTASFDDASKKLTLPTPNATALANTTSKADLGAQVASQTGAGTVTLTKNGNNLSLTLSLGISAPNAITGAIETPPPPYAPKQADAKAKELRQLTFGRQWFTLEDLKKNLKDGSGATNKTIDQWVKTWKDAGDLVGRPGVDGDWTFDKSLVEKQEKDNILDAAKTRVGELKTAWERGVNQTKLTFRTADDKLMMLWGKGPGPDPKNKADDGAAYTCAIAPDAITAGVDAAWEHRAELESVDGGVKKPITPARALMALQRETSPNAKSAFQQRVGAAAALDCKDQSLKRVPATESNNRVRGRLDTIHYDLGSEVEGNTGRTGRIMMPDSTVNHPKLPEGLRRAIADKITGKGVRITRGDGAHIAVKVELEMKPGEWVSIKEATGPLFAKARAEIEATPDFDPDLLASIDRWVATDLLSQDEDHHCVPKWLGGPVSPPIYVVLPRVLHNFDDPGTPMDKKPRLGFHQVLNGILRAPPLRFGTGDRPSINADPDADDARVTAWANRDDPDMSAADKKTALRQAIISAFETVLKNAQPSLIAEIKKVIAADAPQ